MYEKKLVRYHVAEEWLCSYEKKVTNETKRTLEIQGCDGSDFEDNGDFGKVNSEGGVSSHDEGSEQSESGEGSDFSGSESEATDQASRSTTFKRPNHGNDKTSKRRKGVEVEEPLEE